MGDRVCATTANLTWRPDGCRGRCEVDLKHRGAMARLEAVEARSRVGR